jgi:hypothetical protein
MASQKNVESDFRGQRANGSDVLPSDQGGMAAPALIGRNENGVSSVCPPFPQKLLNNRGLEDWVIGRNQEPAFSRSRMKAVLQPSESLLDGSSHRVSLLGRQKDSGAGSFDQGSKLRDLRAQDDQDFLDACLLQGVDDVFQDNSAAQRQTDLGSTHAPTFAGRRDQGIDHEN